MEYPPRRIIALIRAGMRDEVLSSDSMWHCLSCYMCTVRCPREVKPTELAHALEALATEHGFRVRGTYTPAMYRSFTGSIKDNGRVHEFGMMLNYYLRTNPLAAVKMLPLALSLLRHGRMPLAPSRIKARIELRKILKKSAEIKNRQRDEVPAALHTH